jgi:hypothetical protein
VAKTSIISNTLIIHFTASSNLGNCFATKLVAFSEFAKNIKFEVIKLLKLVMGYCRSRKNSDHYLKYFTKMLT